MIAIKKRRGQRKHDWRNLEHLEKSLRKAALFLYINPFGEVIDLADLLNPKVPKHLFFYWLFLFSQSYHGIPFTHEKGSSTATSWHHSPCFCFLLLSGIITSGFLTLQRLSARKTPSSFRSQR